MRDIKFRAWDKKSKKIRIVESIGFGELSYYNEGYPVANMIGRDCIHDKDIIIHRDSYQHELMQYTGLKDKNGKEIYEGDIVKYKVKGSDKTYTTVMKFNEEHGAFLFGIYEGVKMPCGKKTRMNKYTRKSVGSVEVIGNIYENPELLEGNNND